MKQFFILLFVYLTYMVSFAYAGTGDINTDNASNAIFIENKGQITDQFNEIRTDIDFKLTATKGLSVFVGDAAIHYQWSKANKELVQTKYQNPEQLAKEENITYMMYRMDVVLLGANKTAEVVKSELNDYYEMYYNEKSGNYGWRANTYNKVMYIDIYPNIDWVLYTKNGQLKHEFIIKEGGKPSDIRLEYQGASSLKINADGSFTATTKMGIITEAAPLSYNKEGTIINSAYKLDENILSYNLDNYSGQLTIDPNIEWGTYYAGLANDYIYMMTGDEHGNTFSVGYTYSSSNIASSGAHDVTYSSSADGFIVKIGNTGNRLFGTYYGGTGYDVIYDVTLDGNSNFYICGYTSSTSGIATSGPGKSGGYDGFLAKFDINGVRNWGQYITGNQDDYALGIIANTSTVYITGYTYSTSGITTSGTHQTSKKSAVDGFIVGYNSSGAKQFGTLYGGASNDYLNDIALDQAGNPTIVGYTQSNADIASNGSYQSVHGGNYDGLIANFSKTGQRNWGTYYGGSGSDYLYCIEADGNGSYYVGGMTYSDKDIATSGAYQKDNAGGTDGVLIEVNNGGMPQWATYYGGSSNDALLSIHTSNNNIYIGGYTYSTSAIATNNNHQSSHAGNSDGFFAGFTNNGSRNWGTYYGGPGYDFIEGISIDKDGNIYVAGRTDSKTDIATPGTLIPTYVSGSYGMIARFCNNPDISKQPANIAVETGQTAKMTVAASGGSLKYQWQTDLGTGFQNLTNSGQYSGVTSNVLTISNASLNNNNQKFKCIITSGACEIKTFESRLLVFPTNVSTLSKDAYSFYPNPASDKLVIKAPKDLDTIEIYSITGKKILELNVSGKQHTLNIQNLTPGMYMLKINKSYTSKFIKH